MKAHARSLIDESLWQDVPENARPGHDICFRDDKLVSRIEAERFPLDAEAAHYAVELMFTLE